MSMSFTLLTVNSNPQTNPAIQGVTQCIPSQPSVRKGDICNQTIVWKSLKL